MRILRSLAALAALTLAAATFADSYTAGGLTTDNVTIVDVKDGMLTARLPNGVDQKVKLSDITRVSMPDVAGFNAAEAARAKPADAAKLYVQALRTATGKQKRLAQARAIPILDAAGNYGDAMIHFVDLYVSSPTSAMWDLHPAKLPTDANSKYLTEAASAINAKITSLAKQPEAQRNLNSLLLEIYNKQGNTTKAAEIAKSMGVDVVVPESTTAVTSAASGGTVGNADIDALIAAGKFEEAVVQLDTALAAAKNDEAVIKLYLAKAGAYRKLNKLDEAAATYLRISSAYPTRTVDASEALYNAAVLQNQLGHKDEAKRLGKELKDKYGRSAAAVKAANAGLL